MAVLALLAALAACLLSPTLAVIPADQVTSLPGWASALPSRQFSGYLPVEDGFLHYWFIESQNNPTTDPVLLWLNGGPGSSSLIGLLTENGPLQTSDESLVDEITPGVPNLIYNPHTWTLNASVVWLEQPKGVGFSYCTNYPCNNNDTSQAIDVYTFLTEFFAESAYGEFAKNDFYITGESYAGVYIPMIMEQIDLHGGINLKGAAIGDGCWGNSVGMCGPKNSSDRISFNFYNGHGMFPQPFYDQVVAACGDFSKETKACNNIMLEMDSLIGNFFIYNIYDTCGYLDQLTRSEIFELLRSPNVTLTTKEDAFLLNPQLKQALVGGALNDYPCGGETVMATYLAVPSVMEALHVKPNNQGMNYSRTAGDLLPLYAQLIKKYRILIYSGDVDGCVPYWGTEEWTREMNYPIVEAWHPWHTISTGDNPTQVKAGYVVQYGGEDVEEFYFLTVNGAGHMVPQFKPIPASVMITRFINKKPF